MPNSLGIAQAVLALGGLCTAILWVVRSNDSPDLSTGTGSRPAEPSAPKAGATNSNWSTRQAGIALLVVATLLILSLIAMLPIAAGAWEALPLARLIAFPWRMLGPALLWAALL
jgi:hypothetical protein